MVILFRIRIPDHFAISLSVTEYDIFRSISISHTVTKVGEMTDAIKGMNAIMHHILGAIRWTARLG